MTWRPGLIERIVCAPVSLFLLVLASAMLPAPVSGGPGFGEIVALLFLLGLGGGLLLHAMGSSVTLTAEEVRIRNLGFARSVLVDEITDVDPGYSGITITTSDGKEVLALAVQKVNIAEWLGLYTRADAVADSIRRAAGLPMRRSTRGTGLHRKRDA